MNLREFGKINDSKYELPTYHLKEGVGLVKEESTLQKGLLMFVSGNIPQQGIVTEGLLSALIDHLESINVGDLRNRETSVAITKLQEALFWIEERKRDRAKRGVSGTKNK